jgi:putative FmdB family regulatory protein
VPIYEYRCEACGHTFELMQKFGDQPADVCEVCGGHVVKVFHPVAIHFRGSGFYTTDYGRSSKSARAGRDEGESASRGEGKDVKETKGGDHGAAKKSSDAREPGGANAAAKAGAGQ